MKQIEVSIPEPTEKEVPTENAPKTDEQLDANWDRWLQKLRIPSRFLEVPRILAVPAIISEWIEMPWNPWCVTLLGPVGSGKTYLGVHAFGFAAHHERDRLDVRHRSMFADAGEIVQAVKDAFDSGNNPLEAFQRCPVLLIDDVGANRGTEFAVDTLSLILRHRYNEELPTIITANVDKLSQLEEWGFDARVVSRLADGIVYKLDGSDRRLVKARPSERGA